MECLTLTHVLLITEKKKVTIEGTVKDPDAAAIKYIYNGIGDAAWTFLTSGSSSACNLPFLISLFTNAKYELLIIF